jgi:hypothetical protein
MNPPEPNHCPRPNDGTAAAAAAWICAFTARWQVALLKHDLSDDYPHVIRVKHRQDDYLALSW